ncbi:hypothetical protein CXX84_08765 [Arthrobacter sp. AFG7.2]|uniref:Abi family protein n=1 Tax=Arthrobacter sp. AFG7.2 TaxID=1688693 RepID=UPI000C9E9DAB|nr:hypothetical protein CXX84_08765 [Arthrobacter sp. AFG7.2]
MKHHLLKYPEQDVPIWAVTDVLSFGNLLFLYELMQTPVRARSPACLDSPIPAALVLCCV